MKVNSTILSLENPIFPGVSEDLFSAVKKSYGEKVVEVVKEVGEEQVEDVVILINHMLPELAATLAPQRRDYGLDAETLPANFPIEEQASNIDDTPTNKMDMESLMGMTDQRLKKLQTLPAASRAIILRKTRDLRSSQSSNFRNFRDQVQAKREKEVEWNTKMAAKMKAEAERKQEVALGQERKRLILLEKLKMEKGPFTNAEEVEEFLTSNVPEKEKQMRKRVKIKPVIIRHMAN